MTTVQVIPVVHAESPPLQVVELEIFLQPASFVGHYDRLEVWRAAAETGPYSEITSENWAPARIKGTAPGPSANLVGKQLFLSVNEQEPLPISFSGVDPLAFTTAATQITQKSGGAVIASVDGDGVLLLETQQVGTANTLRVVESDAAVLLALPTQEPNSFATGHDPRVRLNNSTYTYKFADYTGGKTFFYKTRFRNSLSHALSEFSQPFGIEQVIAAPPETLVLGYLDLIAGDGAPVVGTEVSVRNPFNGSLVDGKLVVGADLVLRSDAAGHVEFSLVRGQKYSVAVSGTNLVKEVTTPTDPGVTSFMLFDPAYSTQEDYFRARVPQIPIMERRNI